MRTLNEDAIERIIRSQQLCESLTVRYLADLTAFDDQNRTVMAMQFRSDVLMEVQNEEYQRAIAGLDKFITDYLNDDPLLRIDFRGLAAILRPVLVVLTNAQQHGLDTRD
jgi:hypothetical protein